MEIVNIAGIRGVVGGETKRVKYLGPEMIDQVNWILDHYWDAFEACWTEGAGLLVCNGTGTLKKNSFWVAGVKYRVVMGGVRAGGNCRGPYDNVTIGGTLAVTGTISYDYIPSGVNMFIYAVAFSTCITELSIKRILYKDEDE